MLEDIACAHSVNTPAFKEYSDLSLSEWAIAGVSSGDAGSSVNFSFKDWFGSSNGFGLETAGRSSTNVEEVSEKVRFGEDIWALFTLRMSAQIYKMDEYHIYLDIKCSKVASHSEDSSEDISIGCCAFLEEVDSVCCSIDPDDRAKLSGEHSSAGTSWVTRFLGTTLKARAGWSGAEVGTSPSDESESDSIRPRTTRILEGDEAKHICAD
jgi:hypothetical protein